MNNQQFVKSICPTCELRPLWPSQFIILGLNEFGINKWETLSRSKSYSWRKAATQLKKKMVKKLEE